MIEKITLKDIASYIEEREITDLKKVNFFFGNNGSGKSTISNFLNQVKNSDDLPSTSFKDCSVEGFSRGDHNILVFNEGFIDENFRNKEFIKGIFTLNKGNELIDKEIEKKEKAKKKLDKILESRRTLIGKINDDRRKKEEEITQECWMQRDKFSSFSKISLEHPRNKRNHLEKLENILGHSDTIDVYPISNLSSRYYDLFEADIVEILNNVRPSLYLKIRRLEIKLSQILNEVIVGNEDIDLANLINALDARKWVQEGQKLLEKSEDVCPFCQHKTIDEIFKEKLESFFDENYKSKLKEIQNLKSEYESLVGQLNQDLNTISTQFNTHNLVTDLIIKLKDHIDKALEIIDSKSSRSNEQFSFISIQDFKEGLSNIISSIKENNKNYSTLAESREELIADMWNHMASECQSSLEEWKNRCLKYDRILNLIDESLSRINQDIHNLNEEIQQLLTQTINTQEAVDNINQILKNSGFEGFEICEKEKVNNISQYFLKRPTRPNTSQVFKSLSEGEKNFISFLYFYQLCIGSDGEEEANLKKIIVIDDPVSSLDNQSLFIVSTLIHRLIQRKGETKPERQEFLNDNFLQVFILTHNLYFYKEVSFDKRPTCTKYRHFKLTKVNNQTEIEGRRDRYLSDDYTMLWESLKSLKKSTPDEDKSYNILIANSMRRILDTYVNFIGIGKDAWALTFELDKDSPEYYLKCAFLSSINDGSHGGNPLDELYFSRVTNEEPSFLFDTFKEIFRTIGVDHYEKMMNEEIQIVDEDNDNQSD